MIGTSATTSLIDRSPNTNGFFTAVASLNSTELSYCKVGNKFRIAVIGKDKNKKTTVTPWSECQRDLKLESIRRLPELLTKILLELDKRIDSAETALSNVSEILDIDQENIHIKGLSDYGMKPESKKVKIRSRGLTSFDVKPESKKVNIRSKGLAHMATKPTTKKDKGE